jgi:hypothetical protein
MKSKEKFFLLCTCISCTEIFTDMHGKNNMSNGLVEILSSAAGEIFMGKNHTVLNETAYSSCM